MSWKPKHLRFRIQFYLYSSASQQACNSTPITACMVATAQVNERWQISTPRASETIEWISMKLGMYNYFRDMTTHENP